MKYLTDSDEQEYVSHISYYAVSKNDIEKIDRALEDLEDIASHFYEDFENKAHNFREFYRKLKNYLQTDILEDRELSEEFTDILKRVLMRLEEVEHAMEEGIKFSFLTNPTKINGDESNNVKSITCIKMELGEPDASGRRRPVEIPDSEYDIDIDEVIMALGTSPNPLIKSTTEGLETQKWGGIIADEETGLTSRKNIYAGGDAVTGAATVILAMGAGKKAAVAIAKDLLK